MKLDTLETFLIWDKNPRVLPLNFGLSLRRLTISSVGVVSVSQKPSLLCMETVFCLRLALHGRKASQHWDSNWLQLKLSCMWVWAKLADHTELEQRSWVQRAAWCHSWEVTSLGKTQLSLVPPSLKLREQGGWTPGTEVFWTQVWQHTWETEEKGNWAWIRATVMLSGMQLGCNGNSGVTTGIWIHFPVKHQLTRSLLEHLYCFYSWENEAERDHTAQAVHGSVQECPDSKKPSLPGLPKAICVFYRKALGLELVLENFKLTVKYGNNPQGT